MKPQFGSTAWRCGPILVEPGVTGAGYGDPAERDLEAVRDDVRTGKVSDATARTVYSFVR